jgi:hypothetical protein
MKKPFRKLLLRGETVRMLRALEPKDLLLALGGEGDPISREALASTATQTGDVVCPAPL